jgi:uncharacterized protein (TIGR03437 family)
MTAVYLGDRLAGLFKIRKLAMVLTLFASCAAGQGGYFSYPSGVSPNGVTTADVNGDGFPDLVVSNRDSKSLTVLRNDGKGGFAALSAVPINDGLPITSVAADLNRDGKTDLLVTTTTGLVVLLGNQDGTFRNAPTRLGSVTSVRVADLNGDGIPDLAATFLVRLPILPTSASFGMFLGNGDGTFQAAASFLPLEFTPWAALTITDFNGDRIPDVGIAVGHRLTVLTNDGGAKFTQWLLPGDAPWNFAPEIEATDVNGDGVLDIVVAGEPASSPISNGEGLVTILFGKGDGTFQVNSKIVVPSIGYSLAVRDLNGDGRPDLAVGLNCLLFLAGHGDGTFKLGTPFGAWGNTGYWVVADFAGGGRMGFAGTSFAGTGQAGNIVVLLKPAWPSLDSLSLIAAGLGLGPMASGSIATAFGSALANQVGVAPGGGPLPLLAGTSVIVTDAAGNSLSGNLYYVSPGQVNYVIPAASATGDATVTISSSGVAGTRLPIQIARVAPGLFTLNAANLAAAYVTRVDPNGAQTVQPVYQSDEFGNLVASAIDLRPAGTTFYLTVFGTGIRNGLASGVTASVGPVYGLPVTYAGSQGSNEGLDQVNVRLPSGPGNPLTFAGSYSAAVQLTVDGQPSNRVIIRIQ